MCRTGASTLPPSRSPLLRVHSVWTETPPPRSHIQPLCYGPECTKLLHGLLIFTDKPASAPRSTLSVRLRRVHASSQHPLDSTPDLYLPAHSPRQKPKPNYCLFPLSRPPHHRSAWALSPIPYNSDPSGYRQDELSMLQSKLHNYNPLPLLKFKSKWD